MIAGIIEFASRVKYGMTSRNVPIYLFRPLDPKLTLCIVGSSLQTNVNTLAVVDVPYWNPTGLSRGHVVSIIGKCGDFEAEQKALVIQYSPNTWNKNLTFTFPSLDRKTIYGHTFNVDPPDCKDIDDVFTFGDDGYYYITIADVAEWIKLNPFVTEKAHRNGQTLYDNGKVVRPMIPFEEHCSLVPRCYRLGISLRFRIDNCQVYDISFHKTQIVNDESYTYNSIQTSVYAPKLREISHILSGQDSVDSHDWIASLMIFYNLEAANFLRECGHGILRMHESPDEDKLAKYSQLGVSADILAMKSAVYVSATTANPRHWGLEANAYTHATSPIRRFADIINQFVLKGEEPPVYSLELLNERTKELKKYERDSFFLRQLEPSSKNKCVDGITLNDHRVWIPDWKRIVTCKNQFPEGTKGTVYFSLDMTKSTWKRRMVFRFEEAGYMG